MPGVGRRKSIFAKIITFSIVKLDNGGRLDVYKVGKQRKQSEHAITAKTKQNKTKNSNNNKRNR